MSQNNGADHGMRTLPILKVMPTTVAMAITNATGKENAKLHARRCGFMRLTQAHIRAPM